MPTPNQAPPLRPVAQASRWLPGKTVQRFAKTTREASGRGGGSLQGSLRLACHCFWRPPSLRLALLTARIDHHFPPQLVNLGLQQDGLALQIGSRGFVSLLTSSPAMSANIPSECTHARRTTRSRPTDGTRNSAPSCASRPDLSQDDLAVTATAGIPVAFDIVCPANPEPCPAALTITTQTRYEIPASTPKNPVCQC